MKNFFNQKGSLLLEILLAVAVGAIIIGAVAGLVYVSSRSGQVSGAKSSAISLAEEGLEAMQSISETDWHNIYLPPSPGTKGFATEYYVYNDGSSWLLTGTDISKRDIEIDGIIYARKIYIDNVSRNKTGERQICTGVGICMEEIDDPSTQKIKVVVSKEGSADIVLEEYLTRWKNETISQSDWSGGSGQADPTVAPYTKFDSVDLYESQETIDYSSMPGSIKLKPL